MTEDTETLRLVLGYSLIITECETFDGAPIEQGNILRRAFDLLHSAPERYELFRFRTMLHVSAFESAALSLKPESRILDISIDALRPEHEGRWTLASFDGDDGTRQADWAAWSRFPALAITAAILKLKCKELVKSANISDQTPHTRAPEEGTS